MGKQGESEDNIEKHGKTGRIRRKQKNMGKQAESTKNMGKQGESENNIEKPGKTERINEKHRKKRENRANQRVT